MKKGFNLITESLYSKYGQELSEEKSNKSFKNKKLTEGLWQGLYGRIDYQQTTEDELSEVLTQPANLYIDEKNDYALGDEKAYFEELKDSLKFDYKPMLENELLQVEHQINSTHKNFQIKIIPVITEIHRTISEGYSIKDSVEMEVYVTFSDTNLSPIVIGYNALIDHKIEYYEPYPETRYSPGEDGSTHDTGVKKGEKFFDTEGIEYIINNIDSYLSHQRDANKINKFNESLKEALTFQDWLDKTFYPGFDTTDLSDEEYYELEDAYYAECNSTEKMKTNESLKGRPLTPDDFRTELNIVKAKFDEFMSTGDILAAVTLLRNHVLEDVRVHIPSLLSQGYNDLVQELRHGYYDILRPVTKWYYSLQGNRKKSKLARIVHKYDDEISKELMRWF